MPTIPELFALALKSHQAGDLSGAAALYAEILASAPGHADAWHLLGLVAHQRGERELAIRHIRKAVALKPSSALFHNNLGIVFQESRQGSAAMVHYREALRIRPDYAEAHNNLGNVFKEQGELSEAEACYRAALRFRSDYADAHYNLGLVCGLQCQQEEAVAHYREVLRIRPDYTEAYNNLGNILKEQGALAAAEACYRQSLHYRPDQVEIHYNLGALFLEQGKLPEATACLETALKRAPHDMGSRLQYACAEAYNNLGFSLYVEGRLAEAALQYAEALRLKPDYDVAHSNLLFCLCHDPRIAPERIFFEHCRWAAAHGTCSEAVVSHGNDATVERRLKVGYVSADFRAHPVSRFLEPILVHHDPEQVEVFCYANVQVPDAVTTRLRSLTPQWRFIQDQSDRQVVEWIQNDRIDILVDLSGHTGGNRLRVFAHKPAPIQVTFLGYPCTTGLKTVDYRLTDAVADPPGEPRRDTEELVRLPHGVCVSPLEDAPAVTDSPARQTGRITFVSVHRIAKLNVQVIDLWCRLLRMLPRSRLVVSRRALAGRTKEELQRHFAERNINEGQLELSRPADAGDFMGIFRQADIFLDTFPYGGCTTCCEALWMGVPVLTLRGDRSMGRVGASLLTHLGLPDWIAETQEEYVRLAVEHARDLDRLAELRAGLRGRMRETLCDGATFTRHLEEAYRGMWRTWCARRKG